MGILEEMNDKISRINTRLEAIEQFLIKEEQSQDRQDKEKRIKDTMTEHTL
jgi:hypothetical protein